MKNYELICFLMLQPYAHDTPSHECHDCTERTGILILRSQKTKKRIIQTNKKKKKKKYCFVASNNGLLVIIVIFHRDNFNEFSSVEMTKSPVKCMYNFMLSPAKCTRLTSLHTFYHVADCTMLYCIITFISYTWFRKITCI